MTAASFGSAVGGGLDVRANPCPATATTPTMPSWSAVAVAVMAEPGSAGQALSAVGRRHAAPELARALASLASEHGQALRQRLNWLYRQVQRLHGEASLAAALEAELRPAKQTLLEHARRQRLTAPLAWPGHDPVRLNVAARQAGLHPGDALVEWGSTGDEPFACGVVTPRQVWAPLASSWGDTPPRRL